jgi:hypothetical protein
VLINTVLHTRRNLCFIFHSRMKDETIFHPWMEDEDVWALKWLVRLGKWRSGRRYRCHFFHGRFCQNLALSCGCVFRVTEGLFQPNYTILLPTTTTTTSRSSCLPLLVAFAKWATTVNYSSRMPTTPTPRNTPRAPKGVGILLSTTHSLLSNTVKHRQKLCSYLGYPRPHQSVGDRGWELSKVWENVGDRKAG